MHATLKLIGGAFIFSTAYLMKDFYSQANSEDLGWIIGPTAWLVELFTSLSFSPEPGYGWVDVTHNVVIAPVCAGINFLIIAFCMSSFQILWKKHSRRDLIFGIVLVCTGSYLLTILANAMRIMLAVTLFKLDIYYQWLTPDMVHRITGVVVYYLFLCTFSVAVDRFLTRANSSVQEANDTIDRQIIFYHPLFWYLLVLVGVPLANNAFRSSPDLFWNHAITIVALTAALTLVFSRTHLWLVRLRGKKSKPR